jgi:hypothetical protein
VPTNTALADPKLSQGAPVDPQLQAHTFALANESVIKTPSSEMTERIFFPFAVSAGELRVNNENTYGR